MVDIEQALLDFNPWWTEDYQLDFKHREVYEEIKEFLETKQIIALTGLRRVGKTTIMKKIVEDHINNGFPSTNIVYFSFDEFREAEVREVLSVYEDLVETDLTESEHLVLLDEVQKVSDWANKIKRIYDVFENVKIVVSGSESLFVRKDSKETLAGRIFEFKVETLTFKEFLNFKDVEYEPIGLHKDELEDLLEEFTKIQGFPELVGEEKRKVIRKYIRESVIEKIIYQDIPNLFNIRDVTVLESLMNILIEEPGQLIKLSDLCDDLGVSRQTLSNYISYLESSYLLRKLYNYSGSRRKVERKLKKYYPAIISPDLAFSQDTLKKSKAFEWLLVTQAGAEFFWRDPYKNEVDMVLGEGIPVEIKYGDVDVKGVRKYMEKHGVDKGFIVTQEKEEKRETEEGSIHILPAYKFLLEEQFK